MKSNKKSNKSNKECLISPCEFEGLAGFEEIKSYKLIKQGNKLGKNVLEITGKSNEVNINKKKANKKKKLIRDVADKPQKFRAPPSTHSGNGHVHENNLIPNSNKNTNRRAKKRKRRNDDEAGMPPLPNKKVVPAIDEAAWRAIFAPPPVIEAIKQKGFYRPTEIQMLTIPAAIKGRKDIIGAAETGSGKTLAFGIPIIDGILREQRREAKLEALETENEENSEQENFSDDEEVEDVEDIDEEDNVDNEDVEDVDIEEVVEDDLEEEEDVDNDDSENEVIEENGIGCVKVINNVKFDFLVSDDDQQHPLPKTKLQALIITPTRELAIQIQKHLNAILTFTSIKTAVIIGGFSQEKQERILRKGPEIVIATPGRLWEMIQQRNPHFAYIADIKFLAIDETDRMLEKGHFMELQQILELVNGDKEAMKKRQNFVFSATITLIHNLPQRLEVKKKKVTKLTKEVKVESLIKLIGIREKPKIVDITRKHGTAALISESKIFCEKEEKEIYLYYFLTRFPGRTLIFCNSINCVNRLANLLNLLQFKPKVLHALKQQKQRLKHLEYFTNHERSILLATDVAARGIDIPGVNHIVHFEVPKTAEVYVHRSGRTARAYEEGVSVVLVEPSELSKYKQVLRTLNRTKDIPHFPVVEDIFSQLKKRVEIAKEIETADYGVKKVRKDDAWLQKMADEAGLDVIEKCDDQDIIAHYAMQNKKRKRELDERKLELKEMLSKPVMPSTFSWKFPTSGSSLPLPAVTGNKKVEDAVKVIKGISKENKFRTKIKVPKTKVKKVFRKGKFTKNK